MPSETVPVGSPNQSAASHTTETVSPMNCICAGSNGNGFKALSGCRSVAISGTEVVSGVTIRIIITCTYSKFNPAAISAVRPQRHSMALKLRRLYDK